MISNRTLLPLIGLCVLGACQPAPPQELPQGQPACQADAFQGLKWLDVGALDAHDLPRGTRIIYPDMAVTMDYRVDRLNFQIGKTNRIERIFCG